MRQYRKEIYGEENMLGPLANESKERYEKEG